MLRIHTNSISTDKPTTYLIGTPTKFYGAIENILNSYVRGQ